MSTAYGSTPTHDPALLTEALKDANTTPFWLDNPNRPEPRPALTEDINADLLIVGGGFCGLWTAIIAKERHPEWDVVVVEKRRIAWAASGRNGGFCESNLTHGDDNGKLHFPNELATIHKLADENFAELHRTITQYNIDAEWENTGVMVVATENHQVPWITNSNAQQLNPTDNHGHGNSPVYRAALFKKDGYSFVHPAKLAWGLAEAAEKLGVTIYENTEITDLKHNQTGATAHTPEGKITATKVALATNAFPSLLRHLRLFTLPVYDYAIVTEPLTNNQLKEIGWTQRNGITDSGKEFHYYRKTADNRILFGGWDAIYHRGRKITPRYDQRPETFRLLVDHLYTTFPSLKGTKITHAWGGVIDMSTQLVAFHGTTRNKTVAYSAGFTGLGLGATRFGAETMLDLLEGKETERTRLKMARRLPIPIPPEPIAYPLVQIMRRAVNKSDQNGGKDGLLLKLMGLFKIGFDS
ncbi:glycine/D-amino acid oxidase, deaminating [Corynebacterium mustelae]|uniref:Glycine/D-amino acid oxidase, deaminating n=1 Tax=Corynebacterium mustelae TaxID=571915 RepID=A0A0G3H4N5_9CORY|nr:FAD-dependent oxidoreductase [Corynebacterium mustelae]AKK06783.1 glycine/D-amino acid oxidase, deaminating [Corynebacterium mustelae]